MKQQCPLMVAFTTHGQGKLIYCGRWACPICAKRNANRWASDTFYGIRNPAQVVGKTHFWTFTMPAYFNRPADAYKALPRLWDTLRKAIQRDQKKFTFIAFVEGQPERSFMPHFHIITFNHIFKGNSRRKDPLKWIKDFAVRCGFGFEAYDEIVTSKKAASYVAKYSAKGCPEIPKNFRRVRCSRNWQRKPLPELDPYIVRSVGEVISDYLYRVAEATGIALQDIADSYEKMTNHLAYQRIKTT